jgi:hypothetical protein
MAAPVIQVTGSTSGATLAGIDKDDLVEGEVLTFVDTAPENAGASYEWSILDAPVGAAVSLVNPETASPTLTVPADADLESGTILVESKIDEQNKTSIRVSLGMPNSDGRIPHWQETDAANEDGNTKGWHKAKSDWMRAANRRLLYIVTADPSAGGEAAPVGAIARRENGGAGEVWIKVGATDTDWELIYPRPPFKAGVDYAQSIPLAGLSGNDSATYVIAGQLQFNPQDYAVPGTTMTLFFEVVASNGAPALTTHAQLYNVTDAEAIATLNFTLEDPTHAEAALTLGGGAGEVDLADKMYEVRIYVDAPVDETSTIELGGANLRVINTID